MGWSGDIFGEVLTFSYPTQVNQNLNAPSASYYAFNLSQGPPAYNFPAIPSTGNSRPNGIGQPTRPLTMRIPTLARVEFYLAAGTDQSKFGTGRVCG